MVKSLKFWNCVKTFTCIIPGISLAQITRHASEIVNMALDLMSISSDLEFQAGPETKLRLRMGIHTGNALYTQNKSFMYESTTLELFTIASKEELERCSFN